VLASVALDKDFPELDEWDNELQVIKYEEDVFACIPSCFEREEDTDEDEDTSHERDTLVPPAERVFRTGK
jgi:hypothetical protein